MKLIIKLNSQMVRCGELEEEVSLLQLLVELLAQAEDQLLAVLMRQAVNQLLINNNDNIQILTGCEVNNP